MFNLSGGSGLAAASASHIVNAADPIPNAEGSTNSGTIGFSLSFAREYIRNNPSKNVLIIAFGFGNSGFDLGSTSGNFWNVGDTHYNNANTRIARAIDSLQLFSPSANINIAAFLWHQGEFNEGGTQSATAGGAGEINYRTRLLATLKGLRSSALTSLKGSASTPAEEKSIPILIGGVTINRSVTATQQTTGTSATMRTLLNDFATTNSGENITYVPSSIIATIRFNSKLVFNHNLIENSTGSYVSGGQHFNKPSMMEFGKRYHFYYHKAKNAAANPTTFSGGATQSNLPLGFTEDPVVGGKSFKDILDMKNRKKYSKKQKGGADGSTSVVQGLDDSLEGVQTFLPNMTDFKDAIPPATAAQYRSLKSDSLDYLSNTEIVNELKTCLASKSSVQLLTTDVMRDANTTDDNSATGRDPTPTRAGVNRFTELVNCLRTRLLSYAATNELNDAQITGKPAYPPGSAGICTYTKFSDPPTNTIIEDQIRRQCSDTSALPSGFAPYSVSGGGKRAHLRRSKKNRSASKKNKRRTNRVKK